MVTKISNNDLSQAKAQGVAVLGNLVRSLPDACPGPA